jgi:hypothetical protein
MKRFGVALAFGACAVALVLASVVAANSLFAVPAPTDCGTWSSPQSVTGAAITAQYGEIRNCLLVDKTWVLTTLGRVGSAGVVATLPCADATCLDPRIDHPLSAWNISVAPNPGGATVLRSDPTNGRVLVSNGGREFFFDLRSLIFSPAGS